MNKRKRSARGNRRTQAFSSGLTKATPEADAPTRQTPAGAGTAPRQVPATAAKPVPVKLPVYPENRRRLWSKEALPMDVRLLYAVLSAQKELESEFYFRPSSTVCAELARALEILGYESVIVPVVAQLFEHNSEIELLAQPAGDPIAIIGGRIGRSGPRLSTRLRERHYLVYAPAFKRLIDPAAFYSREVRDLLFRDNSLMAPALVPVRGEELLKGRHPIGFVRRPYLTAYSIHDDWRDAQAHVRGDTNAEVEPRAVSIAWRAASVVAMMHAAMPGFMSGLNPELLRIIGASARS